MQYKYFSIFPETLLVQFDRFSSDGDKINEKIECDLNIILYEENGNTAVYELASTICHNGPTLNSGHYITISKTSKEMYHKFDDSNVSSL